MKASLQLKHSQNLTMTPQLQQAIKLLQLSSLELQLEIKQMLESNPLLEMDSDADEFSEYDYQESEHAEAQESDEDVWENEYSLSAENFEQLGEQALYDYSPDDIRDDLQADPSQTDFATTASDYDFDNTAVAHSETQVNLEAIHSQQQNLADYLLEQLNLCTLSERDKSIAYLIIESLDDNGYLHSDISKLGEILNNSREFEEVVENDEVLAVLHQIQNFEPSGIAARNLQECLQIQLRQLPASTPFLKETVELVNRYLGYLENKDFTQIRRKTGFSEDTLTAVIRLVQSLNPYPGSIIRQEKTEYIVPDIIVRKHKGRWIAELNEDVLPKVQLNRYYASLLKHKGSKADQNYLKTHLQEARWFIKSLQSRHETLLRVAQEILRIQQDFFEHGDEAMKPLVLHDIAQLVEMHESTISRVTTQKYLICPKGVFELKYFFSSHVSTDSGGECSSTAIRAHIKKLISGEDRKKPLSDSKIAKLLAAQNMIVARRTIAKYREALSIPPSNERKQLL